MNASINTDTFLNSFKKGDSASFKIFYDDTVRHLLNTLSLYKMSHGLTPEDFASDAYYKVFKNRSLYESYEHAKRSLFKIAQNACTDCQRRSNTEMKIKERLLDVGSFDEYDYAYEELLEELMSKIKKLPNRMRLVMEEVVVNGRNKYEIAKMFGISPQTVLNFRNKAVNKLMILCVGKIHHKKGIRIA